MRVSILGSTGSIGRSTLSVIAHVNSLDKEHIEIDALIAGRDAESLARQARTVGARLAVVSDHRQYQVLKHELSGSGIEVAAGEAAVLEAASRPVDKTMAAIAGTAGLLPTLAAIDAGNTILLANKETMVCAGPIVKERARERSVEIIPVDSEHNAIFQVLEKGNRIEKITLTASGGPFRTFSRGEMKNATISAALAHPNWSMGAKNSLDSATLMNKGLELIEAAYLFDLDECQIDVLIHPQSIVHAMVSYIDGSVLAQLGTPDMRIPIAHALGGGDRLETVAKRLDLIEIKHLVFEAPDPVRFPALDLARQAVRHGTAGTSVFNAANEAAGDAFLRGQCGFLDISDLVRFALEKALDSAGNEMPRSVETIEDVLQVSGLVRRWVNECLISDLKV